MKRQFFTDFHPFIYLYLFLKKDRFIMNWKVENVVIVDKLKKKKNFRSTSSCDV